MKKVTFYFMVLNVFLASCSPERVQYYEETDIVVTKYNEDFDFNKNATYTMPDSVVKITGNLVDGEPPQYVKEPYNSQILDRIEKNMTDLGWRRVDNPALAQLTLLPANWTNTTVYYWYDYWCWYYPSYCGWGYDFNNDYEYPDDAYSASLTTGTLVMSLVVDKTNYVDPVVVWSGAINGILSGEYDHERVSRGIDQAFEQSPYLKNNQ